MEALKTSLIAFAVNHAKWVAVGLMVMMAFFATFFPNMTMDTDPENMLEPTEPARVFHNAAKKQFELSDTIVVGVIKDNDPHGVFNPQTLAHVHALTQFAKTLRYEDPKQPGKTTGVIEVDMGGSIRAVNDTLGRVHAFDVTPGCIEDLSSRALVRGLSAVRTEPKGMVGKAGRKRQHGQLAGNTSGVLPCHRNRLPPRHIRKRALQRRWLRRMASWCGNLH